MKYLTVQSISEPVHFLVVIIRSSDHGDVHNKQKSVGEDSYFNFCRVSGGGRVLVASVTSFIVVTSFTCFLFSPRSSRLQGKASRHNDNLRCSHFHTEKPSWKLQVRVLTLTLPSPLLCIFPRQDMTDFDLAGPVARVDLSRATVAQQPENTRANTCFYWQGVLHVDTLSRTTLTLSPV